MARNNRTEDADDALNAAFEVIGNMPEGRLVLRYVYELTGYGVDTMRQDPNSGEVNPVASLVNQGKAIIWTFIQRRLSRNNRIAIEIPEESQKARRKAKKESPTITELIENIQEE